MRLTNTINVYILLIIDIFTMSDVIKY